MHAIRTRPICAALTALAAASTFLALTVLARHGVSAADVLNALEWSRPYTF